MLSVTLSNGGQMADSSGTAPSHESQRDDKEVMLLERHSDAFLPRVTC